MFTRCKIFGLGIGEEIVPAVSDAPGKPGPADTVATCMIMPKAMLQHRGAQVGQAIKIDLNKELI